MYLRLPHGSTRRRQEHRAAATPPGPVVLFLPAHDEGVRVAAVIERMPSHVCGRPTRCLVVDDGSSDDTSTAAAAAGAHVVRHRTNRGLGAAVRTGLAAAAELDAAVVAFCDADGEYDPAELALLVEPILAGEADYVVGSRFAGTIDRMRPHRRAGNVVLTAALGWICRAPITDGQSGYRAFSRTAAASASVAHDYNYAQVLTIDMLAKGFGYHEVPIHYAFRTSGTSFVRLGRYLRAVTPTVYRQLNAEVPARPATSSVLDDVVAEPVPRDTPGCAVEPAAVVDH
ncbi:MAG: glycosyltransferase family 2 protein [Actinomycetota bacterium]|nr:glycosyltransferase family 2 protein [Actinomycetota bacterium]